MPIHHAEGDQLVKHVNLVVDFNDSGNQSMGTLPIGALLRATVFTRTAWDGVGADLSIGTVAENDVYAGLGSFALGSTGGKFVELSAELTAATEVVVNVVPGTSPTTGESLVMIEYTGT